MRILVFDNDFQPAGDGWKLRWRRALPTKIPQQLTNNQSLAVADEQLDGTELKWLGQGDEFEWLVYRHWLLDENREEPIRDWFAYNGGVVQRELNDVHDFMVEFEIDTGAGSGDFAIELRDGDATATVEIPIVASGSPPRKALLLGSADLAVHDMAFLSPKAAIASSSP